MTAQPWQTDIRMYLPFPYRCAKFKTEDSTALPGFDDGDELAYWCVFPYRKLKAECMGMECPHCELIGHDEYISRIGGTA